MTSEKIIKNSIFLGGSKIIAKLLTTVFTLAIARWSGNEQFGVYSTILTYIAFFSIIEEFGLTLPLIRKIAKRDQQPGKYISEIFGLKLLLSVPAFVSFLVFTQILRIDPVVSVLFGISMVFETLNVSFVRAFEGIETMERIAVITILERLIFGGLGMTALMLQGGMVMIAAAHVGASAALCVMSLVSWRSMKQYIGYVWNISLFKRLLIESMPFAVASIFSVLYMRVDLAILSLFGSSAEVGVYSASFRITDAMIFIPTAIVASIFPVLARSHAAGSGFERYYGKYFAILLSTGVVLGLSVFLFSDWIILTLFGSEFSGSITVLKILCAMVPFTFLNAFVGTALISVNKEKLSTRAIILLAVFNLTVNMIVIPLFGPIGAAATKVGTEVVGVLYQTFMMNSSTTYEGLYTQWLAR
ncbi:MAG: flippase [Bacteriovoracaceae bacterium]